MVAKQSQDQGLSAGFKRTRAAVQKVSASARSTCTLIALALAARQVANAAAPIDSLPWGASEVLLERSWCGNDAFQRLCRSPLAEQDVPMPCSEIQACTAVNTSSFSTPAAASAAAPVVLSCSIATNDAKAQDRQQGAQDHEHTRKDVKS
jgi:hypothetical protein